MLTNSQLKYYCAMICIVLIILFYLPSLVVSKQFCSNGKGYINASDGLCSCISGRYGLNCEYKFCPFAKSWLSIPTQHNKRSMPLSECSDMGTCDKFRGVCNCRPGYDGRACERLSCPGSLETFSSKILKQYGYVAQDATLAAYETPMNLPSFRPCSGHGICMTMRDAGENFDGMVLKRAPVDYSNWDADKIQGCVCDYGFSGYDCSLRFCPYGPDPLTTTYYSSTYGPDFPTATFTPGKKYSGLSISAMIPATSIGGGGYDEVYVIECQADAGFFTLQVRGQYVGPVPFDADPGLLKYLIEQVVTLSVGTVLVTMPRNPVDKLPTICDASQVVSTYIQFIDRTGGSRPPIRIIKNSASTRQFTNGNIQLSLGGSESAAVLRMATKHQITCPICPACTGKVYFNYGNSVSTGIDIRSNNALYEMAIAITSLPDLISARWSNLQVNVTILDETSNAGAGSICSTTSIRKSTIEIWSDYGNIPFLKLIDGTYVNYTQSNGGYGGSSSSYGLASANLTWATNAAQIPFYECSNQGHCNRTSGTCSCFSNRVGADLEYRAISSNGKGGPGNLGDCGYIDTYISSCSINPCSAHGYCVNVTNSCQCYDGWFGITCSVTNCPKGRAWFDEPLSATVAHQLAECSNMGSCDRSTGFCTCRGGYSGAACDIKLCPNNTMTGEVCNGRGACLSIAQIQGRYGFEYGNVSNVYLHDTDTWDANNWYECLCTAKTSAGWLGDPTRPSIGPSAMVSGIATTSPPLPGWGSWDCSARHCSRGDTISARYHGGSDVGGLLEIQRVMCSSASTSNHSFILEIFGQPCLPIYANYNYLQIKTAIEYNPLIGNVSISFPFYSSNNVTTACSIKNHRNLTESGFLVTFDTEFGDLPLMASLSSSTNVTIASYQDGTKTNLECSGATAGSCDTVKGPFSPITIPIAISYMRDNVVGLCVCNARQVSGNGSTSSIGSLGDCSHKVTHPLSTDASNLFYNTYNNYDDEDY